MLIPKVFYSLLSYYNRCSIKFVYGSRLTDKENILQHPTYPLLPIPMYYKELIFQQFKGIALDVNGLIIGFHKGEAKIFKIDPYGDYEEYTSFGYTSVGSGHSFSEIYFDQHDYMPNLNAAEGLFFAYRAKKSAEFNTGVGKKTDIVLITSDGKVLEIVEESNKMQRLKELHQESTNEIKKIRETISEKIDKEVLNG